MTLPTGQKLLNQHSFRLISTTTKNVCVMTLNQLAKLIGFGVCVCVCLHGPYWGTCM
jgi:hypothetical protein